MDYNSRPNSVDSSLTSPNASNHFYHHSSPQQQFNGTQPVTYPVQPSAYAVTTGGVVNPQTYYQNNEYLSQYYSQYYREYYRQWLSQHNRHSSSQPSSHLSSLQPQLKQPLKYGTRKCHSRALFSQHNNHLLVVDNECQTSRPLRVYSLNDLFVDYLFPNQMFLLKSNSNVLPFDSRDSCLQWIRCKQQLTTTATTHDYELKLILRIIQMILKQNSRITGLDLSELLFELIDLESLNKTLIYSENDLNLNYFRIYLMRGQKTVALNYALNPSNGLMAHALCLSYLIDDNRRHQTTDDLMLKTIRKFCDTLRPNDPIFVYYNSVLNRIQRKQIFLELSFESFLILLSNEMNLNSIEIKTNSQNFKHLLDLIKCLQTTDDDKEDNDYSKIKDFVLSDELFESEMDAILVNECLEFSLFNGKRFNKKLIEKKLKLISVLFDFGFHSNSLKYCQQLKAFEEQLSSQEKRLIYEIESRFDSNVSFDETHEELNHALNEDKSEESEQDDSTSPQNAVNYVESIPETQETPDFDYYSQLSAPPLSAPPVIAPPVIAPPMEVPNGDPMGFSFVSSSQSLPSMPFDSNDFFENQMKSERKEELTTSEKTPVVTENNAKVKASQSSGLLSKLFNFKPKNQAILPDDSNMTLKWDPNSNQWVDTSQEKSTSSAPPLRPPPIGAPSVGLGSLSGQKKFEFRSQKRYVDITRRE